MRLHHSLLAAITILVLVGSAFFPVPALADGEPPVDPFPAGLTPTDFPLTVDPALVANAPETTPGSNADGLQPTDFPLPVDPEALQAAQAEASVPSAVEAAPTALEPTDFPVSGENLPTENQSESVPEILASLPAETSLALVDARGELQALGSAAGSEILTSGDPAWCPTGRTPMNDPLGECLGPYTSFHELIDHLGSASGAGTIYVAYNYNSLEEFNYTGNPAPGEIYFNPNTLTALTDLTIQGGWDFTTDSQVGSSTLDGYGLLIGEKDGTPWNGSVTIRDLIILNAPGRGLTINATGNLVFEDLTVLGSNTARENNRTGLYAKTAGDIQATRVAASGALSQAGYTLYGAAFFAGGSIRLLGAQFDNNQGFGVLLRPGLTPQPNTVVNVSQASASGNWLEGLTIFNYDNPDQQITLAGQFDGNGGRGIRLETVGDLTLNAVQANGNSQEGLVLYSDNPNAQINLTDSEFKSNGFSGLFISGSGNVSLNAVTASQNAGSGAGIYVSQGNLSLTDSSFSNNGSSGLEVVQDGAAWNTLTLNNVTALGNLGGDGADLRMANGSIAIQGGNFSNNQGDGFYARAYGSGRDGNFPGVGSVTVQNVTASGNRYDGGFIIFDGQATGSVSVASAPVSVTNSTFDANQNWGIDIEAGGSITLNQILARGNAYSGAWLGSGYDGKGASITLQSSTLTGNADYGVYAVPVGGVVSNPATDGALFLNSVVLTGNVLGCSYLSQGRVVENGVLCASLPPTSGDDEADSRQQRPVLPVLSGDAADLPVNTQLVQAGAAVQLDCDQFSASFLKLADGAGALFACPVPEKGQLTPILQEKLPGEVPADFAFAQAVSVDLLFAGATIPSMAIGGQITVQFPIPAGSEGKKLAMLFWDPSLKSGAGDWVELPLRNLSADGIDQTFPLRTPADGLTVLTGVYQENGLVKIVTNFPGVFMLVTK